MERQALNQGVCLATIKLKAPHVLWCPEHWLRALALALALANQHWFIATLFSDRFENNSQHYSVYYSLPVSKCPLRGLFLNEHYRKAHLLLNSFHLKNKIK